MINCNQRLFEPVLLLRIQLIPVNFLPRLVYDQGPTYHLLLLMLHFCLQHLSGFVMIIPSITIIPKPEPPPLLCQGMNHCALFSLFHILGFVWRSESVESRNLDEIYYRTLCDACKLCVYLKLTYIRFRAQV